MSKPNVTATAYLVPRTQRPGLEPSYPLNQPLITVGRHPSNTIVVALDSISRFHSRIEIRGSHYLIQDLNSSNGTFVNGERVSSATLHDGDVVVFGNVDFVFNNEASTQRGARAGAGAAAQAAAAAAAAGAGAGGGAAAAAAGPRPTGLEVRDSNAAAKSVAQKVIKADEARDTSSYISSNNASSDQQTLVKVNSRLSTLYALSELMREAYNHSEKEILQSVLDLIFEAVHADRGAILTRFSRDAKEFDVAVVKYRDQPIVDMKVSVSRTILDRVVNEKVAVLSSDAQSDARFDASESIIFHNIRSTMCVPMISEGRVLGIIHLDTTSTRKSFQEDDLEFVTTLATDVAVSLENMRMREERIHRERLAAVGETVAHISHNVKNILLLSQGGMELLDRAIEVNDPQQVRESWAVVRRGIDKIGKLVKDMLDYSKSKRPKPTQVDVNEMICHIAEEIEEELIKKNIRLELELDERIHQFRTDEAGMTRAVTNLLMNAAEAINHQEGLIRVQTELARDQSLIVRVSDNGVGIPQDKIEKVFFPFFTTKGSSGTGLGLPMCKKLVEDLGGSIAVESTVGEGSTFIIILPADVPSGGGVVEEHRG